MDSTLIIVIVIIVMIIIGIGGFIFFSSKTETETETETEMNSRLSMQNAQIAQSVQQQSSQSYEDEEDYEEDISPGVADEELIVVESGGRCGPEHNEQRCPDVETCSEGGYCGEGEQFDFGAYSKYSGVASSYHDSKSPYTKKCGPQHNMTKCRDTDVCYEDGKCGPWTKAKEHKMFTKYAGEDSCYYTGQGCKE